MFRPCGSQNEPKSTKILSCATRAGPRAMPRAPCRRAPAPPLPQGLRGHGFNLSANHFEIPRMFSGFRRLYFCFLELGPLNSIFESVSLESPTTGPDAPVDLRRGLRASRRRVSQIVSHEPLHRVMQYRVAWSWHGGTASRSAA